MSETDRPLLDFRLRNVTEIAPWGKPGALSLHWFGLTDGWYWMNVGDDQLFVAQDAGGGFAPTDYQVVRLWEDVLHMLPAVLEPVPAEIGTRLGPEQGWLSWHRRATDWLSAGGDLDLFDTAVLWADDRRLDTGYLVASPNIWFCRIDNNVHIFWDNRNRVRNGLPIWSAGSGRIELPVEAFVAEVSGFHNRLIHAMEARVRAIREAWTRPDVRIDVSQLEKEQNDRATWLAAELGHLKARPPTDWAAVAEAIRNLDRLLR